MFCGVTFSIPNCFKIQIYIYNNRVTLFPLKVGRNDQLAIVDPIFKKQSGRGYYLQTKLEWNLRNPPPTPHVILWYIWFLCKTGFLISQPLSFGNCLIYTMSLFYYLSNFNNGSYNNNYYYYYYYYIIIIIINQISCIIWSL